MPGSALLIFSVVAVAAVPGPVETRSGAIVSGSQARNDLNTHADDYGYLPGRRSFYNYPRHRHIDGRSEVGGSYVRPRYGSHNRSPNYDANYGSPYYGTNYGAPYLGGGYYDGGVYYRERRD